MECERISTTVCIIGAGPAGTSLSNLLVLAQAPPSGAHANYALHPRGFAGHMLRSATQSRFYVQVHQNSAVEDWPDQRIWTELGIRMAKDGWGSTRDP
jgi:p-hydroxybenzoate 3-monooxygenase